MNPSVTRRLTPTRQHVLVMHPFILKTNYRIREAGELYWDSLAGNL